MVVLQLLLSSCRIITNGKAYCHVVGRVHYFGQVVLDDVGASGALLPSTRDPDIRTVNPKHDVGHIVFDLIMLTTLCALVVSIDIPAGAHASPPNWRHLDMALS
jgi:hypothetical protein